MAVYVIRIEFEGSPSWAVYDALHARLDVLRVLRTLRGRDNVDYALPHATYAYYCATDLKTEDIYLWLRPHVSGLGHRFKLLVLKIDEWSRNPDEWIT